MKPVSGFHARCIKAQQLPDCLRQRQLCDPLNNIPQKQISGIRIQITATQPMDGNGSTADVIISPQQAIV